MDITYIALTIVLLCFVAISAVLVINKQGDAGDNRRAIRGNQSWLKSDIEGPRANIERHFGSKRTGSATAKKVSPIQSPQTVKPREPLTMKSNNVSDVRTPWGW